MRGCLFDLAQADAMPSIRAIIRPAPRPTRPSSPWSKERGPRGLSHFERGRIAVIAANQGAFANTEDAVNRLYATGSKAKRSRCVRSR